MLEHADANCIPTAIKIERWYGYVHEFNDVYSCRVCGTVTRAGAVCSYCNSFPLVWLVRRAQAAWLDIDEEKPFLPTYERRIRIYETTIREAGYFNV